MARLNRLVLSLGSNLGDREAHLTQACELIREKIGEIVSFSSVYDTPPMGFHAPQSFLNMCVCCTSIYSPQESLNIIHEIEAQMGRLRVEGTYISRNIDIDIIFFNSIVRSHEAPLIPHPSFQLRKFVLLPLNDLDPNLRDPRDQRTVKEILTACDDQSEIHLFKKNLLPFHY